jgi:hypothetical protein
MHTDATLLPQSESMGLEVNKFSLVQTLKP